MYAFLFDRRSLGLVVLAIFLAGLLLFAAGLLVGTQVRLERSAQELAERLESSAFKVAEVSSLAEMAGVDLPVSLPVAEPPPPEPTAEPFEMPTAEAPPSAPPPSPPPPSPPPPPPPPPSSPPPSSPPPPPSSAVEKPPVSSSDTVAPRCYTVQAGAFQGPENAEERLADLAEDGHEPFVQLFRNTKGTLFYTVRVGDCLSRSEAFALARRLEDEIEPDEDEPPNAERTIVLLFSETD